MSAPFPWAGVRPDAGMHVVAVQQRRDRPGALDEPWLRGLADAAGLSRYELRMRLRVLDGWPGVLATFAEAAQAERTAAALHEAGLRAWVLPGRATRPRPRVRRFTLHEDVALVELDGGLGRELPLSDVRMLVHGVRYREARSDAGERIPGGLSVGAWAAPRLGGHLSMGAALRRTTPEAFVDVYARGEVLTLRAGSLRYGELGHGAPEPTRVGNFRRVLQALRVACRGAVYDDRLQGRGGQSRVLGPTLRPERHLDLAIALVVGDAVDSRSPYR